MSYGKKTAILILTIYLLAVLALSFVVAPIVSDIITIIDNEANK